MLSSPHNVDCCYELIINGTIFCKKIYTQLHALSPNFSFENYLSLICRSVLICQNHLPLYHVLKLIPPGQHCIWEIHSSSLLKSAAYPPVEEVFYFILFPFHTAVDVSFSQTNVVAVEAGGSASLILSVTGQLDTGLSVSVQVMSQDGTAIGELQLAASIHL